ncbi:B- and T-lymphocyte attenuator-like [Anomaloglossus baeobatrachus]|uniref:B- and T-lymphocyte attenuator-like n=1 Tax=Anomaloglossus baeobatrachus TaxID=238106 RepID=UPI003F4FEDE5
MTTAPSHTSKPHPFVTYFYPGLIIGLDDNCDDNMRAIEMSRIEHGRLHGRKQKLRYNYRPTTVKAKLARKLQEVALVERPRTVDTLASVMWMKFLGILALVPLTLNTKNQNGSSCVPSLNIPPNTQSSITEGQALILRCPVQSCSYELLNMTWCRTEGDNSCEAVTSGPGVSYEWESNVYVMKLLPACRNDTGSYRCSVQYGGQRITGNIITVNVMEAQACVIRDTSKTWITYFSIALPLVMTTAFYTWIYCFLHQDKGKMEMNSKLISSKVKYVHPSKRATVSIKKNLMETSPMERDPPTESFEIICDDLNTCDDELTLESPKEQDSINEESMIKVQICGHE